MSIKIINTKTLFRLIYLQLLLIVHGLDTIYPGQSISKDQKLISMNEMYIFGFYDDCYTFGIRYNKITQDTVWGLQINFEDSWDYNPFTLRLTLSQEGNLYLILHFPDPKRSEKVVWSSNSSKRRSSDLNSTKLVLENNGNLVIKSITNPTKVLWQSFDHPRDTWLPGAKLRFNKPYVQSRYGNGLGADLLFEIDMVMHSIVLKKHDTRYGSCRLNGNSLSCSVDLGWYNGEVDILLHDHTHLSYVSNGNETYFTYTSTNFSIPTRIVIDKNQLLTQLMWVEQDGIWVPSKLKLANSYCDKFAVYNHEKKYNFAFSPSHESNTQQQYAPQCVSRSFLQCHGGEREGFVLIRNASIINGSDLQVSLAKSPKDCKKACFRNCSCQVFKTENDVCVMGKLNSLDIQYYPNFDLYYRLATTKTTKRLDLTIIIASLGGVCLIITLLILVWKFKSKKILPQTKVIDLSLMLIKYRDLRKATKNFSMKLGEGGFGSVYQGNLPNTSQGIAVKHLKIYGQGDKQFRAEVRTLGIIHHLNLLRLLGFCVEGSKRFLVYEYMPNGSLDKQIFGDNLGTLYWKTRYQIALGIAKGLAYLHNECRECIIHCDIKPENILLDDQFNPKIADFGLAKLVARDFSRVLTTMRGTRGYIAPEWISGSAITSKADVYSYGMMLFEIISGKRNWCLTISGENEYIPLQIMQRLTSGGDIKSLIDSKLDENADSSELQRVCRVAGWCIQEDERERLSMVQVIRILEGNLDVVNPPIPGFLQYIADFPQESTAYHSCLTE